MAFQSVQEIIPNSPKNRAVSSSSITISTDSSRPNGKEGWALRISIPASILSEARLIDGDRVDLLIDPQSRRCLIKRVNDKGWRLHAPAKNKGQSKLNLKMTWHPGMPSVSHTTEALDWEVAPEGIVFTVPENCSFTENMRKSPNKTSGLDRVYNSLAKQ